MTVSQKQLVANRRNAQKSTGPTTAQGKAIASKNATIHGLLSCDAVISGEDHSEFDDFRQSLLDDLSPSGQLEHLLADRIVTYFWKLRRSGRIENNLLDLLLSDQAEPVRSPESRVPRIIITKTYEGLPPKEIDEVPPNQKPLTPADTDTLSEYTVRETVTGDPIADEPDMTLADKLVPQDRLSLGRMICRDLNGSNILSRFRRYESEIERGLFRSLNELQRLQYLRQRNEAISLDN